MIQMFLEWLLLHERFYKGWPELETGPNYDSFQYSLNMQTNALCDIDKNGAGRFFFFF